MPKFFLFLFLSTFAFSEQLKTKIGFYNASLLTETSLNYLHNSSKEVSFNTKENFLTNSNISNCILYGKASIFTPSMLIFININSFKCKLKDKTVSGLLEAVIIDDPSSIGINGTMSIKNTFTELKNGNSFLLWIKNEQIINLKNDLN